MIQDRAGEMLAFVRAVEGHGFSAAARHLELTPSAVSKSVTRLESRLGVRLLNRTTRSVSLTAEGERFYARAQRILADLDEAEQEATRASRSPRGLLRINSGVAFGLHQWPPMLPEFRRRYPDIEIDLSVTDRVVDLVAEGADVALRTGRLVDSTLVARKVCDIDRVICAAPAYLRRHGRPRRPEQLLQHNCVLLSAVPGTARWPFDDRDAPGGVRLIDVRGDLTANNAESVLQMALLGLGIVRLGDIVVGAHLQRGDLVPLLADAHHVEPVPLHLVLQPGRHRLPKVAAFVDFVTEQFANPPWRFDAARPARRRRAAAAKR